MACTAGRGENAAVAAANALSLKYNSSPPLGEDWPRALAHEIGHYAFGLDDNYLGLDAQGHTVVFPFGQPPVGVDQRSPARHPDFLGPDDMIIKVQELREATDWQVPIFIKMGASRVFDDD
jgi:hypothetical protein